MRILIVLVVVPQLTTGQMKRFTAKYSLSIFQRIFNLSMEVFISNLINPFIMKQNNERYCILCPSIQFIQHGKNSTSSLRLTLTRSPPSRRISWTTVVLSSECRRLFSSTTSESFSLSTASSSCNQDSPLLKQKIEQINT
jgi:hypothetical protein